MNPATMFAHGYFACAYAPAGRFAPTAPVLPLVVAALIVVTRVGLHTPMPVPRGFSSTCHGTAAIAQTWWHTGSTETALLVLSAVGWVVMLWGVTALLEATGRALTGWVFLACVIVAVVPPIFMTMTSPAHPEYPLAVGLALLAWSQILRGRAAWAGVLLAVSVLTQESTLLIAIPLAVWSGRNAGRAALAFVIVNAAVVAPLDIESHGRLLSVLSGKGATVPNDSTWLDFAHLHGTALVAASRWAPLALTLGLAVLTSRKLGPLSGATVAPALALVAACFDLRLLFEVNVWGYYFMGVALALVLAMIVDGRWRRDVAGWLVAVSLIFNPLPRLYWAESIGPVPEWIVQVVLVGAAMAISLSLVARFAGALPDAPQMTRRARSPDRVTESFP